MEQVSITRVNIGSPKGCQVKTEKCKNEAYWFVEEMSVCDKHLKLFCKLSGINYNNVVKEIKNKCLG